MLKRMLLMRSQFHLKSSISMPSSLSAWSLESYKRSEWTGFLECWLYMPGRPRSGGPCCWGWPQETLFPSKVPVGWRCPVIRTGNIFCRIYNFGHAGCRVTIFESRVHPGRDRLNCLSVHGVHRHKKRMTVTSSNGNCLHSHQTDPLVPFSVQVAHFLSDGTLYCRR